MLSHDLRSAVSDIVGGVQLMEHETLSEVNKIQLARIAAAANMVLRLLNVVKRKSPPQGIHGAGPLFVAPLLQEIDQRWQGRAADVGVELRVNSMVSEQCCLDCTPLDLERILSNLLDNAVKFSPKGGEVTLDVQEASGFLQLRISDQGPGFSAAAREKLFSFEGRPESSIVPGSGLGLYIVYKITKQLQGEVWVPALNAGGCVTVMLPTRNTDVPLDALEQPEFVTPQLQGKKVLLAEDNKTNQLVAGHMLEILGAEVTLAQDGQEAWDILCEQAFDLALVDIEMPRKSGVDLIREIRASNLPFARMPLVALTAYFLSDHQSRIMAAGANGVIAKPLTDIQALGTAINGFCGFDGPADKTNCPVDSEIYTNLERTMGPAAFGGLVDKLLIDLSGAQTTIEKAFADKDPSQLRNTSHILISLAGAVGALELLKAAQSLNTAMQCAESVDLTSSEWSILPLLRELIEYLETVRNEINGG